MEVYIHVWIVAVGFILNGASSANVKLAEPTTPPPDPWLPPRDPKMFIGGEISTIFTSSDSQAVYTMEDRNNMVFKVKTCRGAKISIAGLSLSTHEGDVTYILIGTSNNQETKILHGQSEVAVAKTPNVLHCNEFRSFWIKWLPGLLEVGKGPVIGANMLISNYDIISVGNANQVVLSPEEKSENAVYEVRENTGDDLNVKTPVIYGYEKLWKSVEDRNFINFRVQACADARIILTSRHGNVLGKVYEIVLGGKDNTESYITTQANGGDNGKIVSLVRGDILACDKMKEFWISWLNYPGKMGSLQVGQGHILGERILMKVVDSNRPISIRHLSVSTANDNIGEWYFEDNLDDLTMFRTQTPADAALANRYTKVWLRTEKKKFMTFYVTAISDVYIHLSTQWNLVDTEFGVELIIGQKGRTLLTETSEPVGALANITSPGIVSMDSAQLFWLSWNDGYIRFGRGRLYDQDDALISVRAPTSGYNAISFTTVGTEGSWRIKDTAGNRLSFKSKPSQVTPLRPDIWRSVRSKKRVSFMTDTCSDVVIALSPSIGFDDQSYYFKLFYSVKKDVLSSIHIAGDGGKWSNLLINNTLPSDGLACGVWRELYLTWYDGQITLGRGRFPSLFSSLLQASSSTVHHHVKALAFSNTGDKDITWSFRQDVGDRFIYHTPTTLEFKQWVQLAYEMSYVSFEVTACSDVNLRLKSEDGKRYINIVLSEGGNNKTVMSDNTGQQGPPGENLLALDCNNPRLLWLEWDSSGYTIGGGTPLDDPQPLAQWLNYANPFNISSIGLSTGNGVSGLWSFAENMGTFTTFPSHRTILPINMQETRRTVAHTRSLLFSVQAGAEVHLGLTEELGVTSKNSLDVGIGTKENTQSVIKRSQSDLDWVTVDTPGVLDKDKMKDFWISWSEGEVQVGKDWNIGQQRFLQYQMIRETNFQAISFATRHGVEVGTWKLPMWDGSAPIVPNKLGYEFHP